MIRSWDFTYYFIILLQEIILKGPIQVDNFLLKFCRFFLIFCIILLRDGKKAIYFFLNFIFSQILELLLFILLQTLEQSCKIIINSINYPPKIQLRQLLPPFIFFSSPDFHSGILYPLSIAPLSIWEVWICSLGVVRFLYLSAADFLITFLFLVLSCTYNLLEGLSCTKEVFDQSRIAILKYLIACNEAHWKDYFPQLCLQSRPDFYCIDLTL